MSITTHSLNSVASGKPAIGRGGGFFVHKAHRTVFAYKIVLSACFFGTKLNQQSWLVSVFSQLMHVQIVNEVFVPPFLCHGWFTQLRFY